MTPAPSLPTIEDLLRRQRAYYEAISTWQRRPWGLIGLNRENPTSHDSNHAYADAGLTAGSLPAILGEVADWYRPHADRGIEPRLRFYAPPNDAGLVAPAERLGWKGDSIGETWRAWPAGAGREEPAPVPGMTVSPAGADSVDALLAIYDGGPSDDAAVRRRGVWSALAASDRTDCLLARVDGEPAAVLACVWNGDWGSVENVHTAEPLRRRGICSALIRHLQALAAERGSAGLYLYDNEEGPDRIYARAGFEFVARVRSVQLRLPTPT